MKVRVLYLILLKVCSDSPALVIGQGVPIFLEKGVDTRNTPVPGILQILKSQTPVATQNIILNTKKTLIYKKSSFNSLCKYCTCSGQ